MKILFVYQQPLPFVVRDLEILQRAHEVQPFQFRRLKDLPALWQGVRDSDITFSWFGKLHAFFTVFLSRTLNKKAVVVSGGDDVACEPEIGYGMFVHWWKRWCPLFVFRYADLVLSVSSFNRSETIRNAKAQPDHVLLLHHGFDARAWRPVSSAQRNLSVATVGRVTDETVVKKGLDVFVRSAAYLQDVPFRLIGPGQGGAVEGLRRIAAPNVSFSPGLFGQELAIAYSQARVYAQASVHESFSCSLAEAMLCECVPVVSRRAALPEVAGECGFYMDEHSPQALAAKVREALGADPDFGRRARERIMDLFPLEKREAGLLRAVHEVMA